MDSTHVKGSSIIGWVSWAIISIGFFFKLWRLGVEVCLHGNREEHIAHTVAFWVLEAYGSRLWNRALAECIGINTAYAFGTDEMVGLDAAVV